MTTKERLHKLVDELSEGEADATLEFAVAQRENPLLRVIANAPEDNEPFTAEDEAAVTDGRADFAAGRTVSHEEMLRRYG